MFIQNIQIVIRMVMRLKFLQFLYLVSSETSISTNFFTSDETLELGLFDHRDIQNIVLVNRQYQEMINDFFENNFPIDR